MRVYVAVPKTCNLSCEYCYQKSLHGKHSLEEEIDFDAIVKKINEMGVSVELSGGESLLLDNQKLERILRASYRQSGGAQLQTNGVLIDDEHMEMFEKYNVRVGISVDGSGRLNDLRAGETPSESRENTRRIMRNIEKLSGTSVDLDIISMFTKCNVGTESRLAEFKDFLLWLRGLGIEDGEMMLLRASALEDNLTEEVMVTPERLGEVWVELARFFRKYPELIRFPFTEMKKVLVGRTNRVNCFWKNCDPWRGFMQRQIDKKGRVLQKRCWFGKPPGFRSVQAENKSSWRTVNLFYTPQAGGGVRTAGFF